MPVATTVDVQLEIGIINSETIAVVVNSILEILLFQRNQIPFVWETYKSFISNWSENNSIDEGNIKNFEISRQKALAKRTKDEICFMKEIITKIFQTNTVTKVRFLFGPTAYTPKESYTICIPKISRSHLSCNYQIPKGVLNEALISLLTCESLYSIFDVNMLPTNIYLELEILDSVCLDLTNELISKESCSLVPNCKDVYINLNQRIPITEVESLQKITVFNDFECLSIKESNTKHDSQCSIEKTLENSCGVWYEANLIVRGFKNKPLKDTFLWRT